MDGKGIIAFTNGGYKWRALGIDKNLFLCYIIGKKSFDFDILPGLYIGIIKRYRDKYYPLPSMRLTKGWGTNICPAYAGLFLFKGEDMTSGNFYYISDEYYSKFPGCNLMGNKDPDAAGSHGRPCFYCFKEGDYNWMIPISSQIDKFHALYEEKMLRYHGNFDGIRFGYVNGQERAFLIQNVCPVTDQYIDSEYRIERNTRPVVIDSVFARELNGIIRKVLRLYKKGTKIVLTELDTILAVLEKEIAENRMNECS